MKNPYIILAKESDETSVSNLQVSLEEDGFVVEDCIVELGTIVVSMEEAEVEKVRSVAGVASVQEEGTAGTY